MERNIGNGAVEMLRGDITTQQVDAIVNAANSSLMGGGGVDGAIHRAGGPEIHEQCVEYVRQHGRLPPGKAMYTTGGTLPARYVIHTVGPVWHGGSHGEPETLASAYTESLRLAESLGVTSVAFPSISTGAYGYPTAPAAAIALATTAGFFRDEPSSVTRVVFVLFDAETFRTYMEALETLV